MVHDTKSIVFTSVAMAWHGVQWQVGLYVC